MGGLFLAFITVLLGTAFFIPGYKSWEKNYKNYSQNQRLVGKVIGFNERIFISKTVRDGFLRSVSMHPVVRFKDQAGMEHDFESRFAAPFVAKDLNQEVTVIYSASDETSTEMDILWLYFLLPVGALFTAFFFYISTGIILYFRVIKGRF